MAAALPLVQALDSLNRVAAELERDDGTKPEAGPSATITGPFLREWRIAIASPTRLALVRELAREEIEEQRAALRAELKTLGIET